MSLILPNSRIGRLHRLAAFARMQCANRALERDFGYLDDGWEFEEYREWLRKMPGYADWALPLMFAPSLNNPQGLAEGGGGSSITLTGYTPTSGSNGVLVAAFASTDNNGTDALDTFTYAGNALTQVVTAANGTGPTATHHLMYVDDPLSLAASGDVVGSRTGNINGRGVVAVTLLDAEQGGPTDSASDGTDTASPYDLTINVTDADALVVGALNIHDNQDLEVNNGQTRHFTGGAANVRIALGSIAPGATGNFNDSWTSIQNEECSHCAAAWHPAAAAAGQPTMRRWGGVRGMTPGSTGMGRSW